jgi:penicillin amidase
MPIRCFSLQSTQVIRSWFRYALLALAVLVIGLFVFVYWAGYRVLPQVDGEVAAPLKQPGSITRDPLGVPTITASSTEDALFLQGYATAQDRLFQMDALRRKAAGELSEVLGPATQELDLDSRRLRLARAAEVHAKTMPPADRAALSAYARGINHYIRTHRNQLPMEFTLLNYDPKPWTPSDTVLVGLEMYRNLTTTWKHEIQKQTLLETGNPEKVNFLYPPRAGGEIQPGSNAWAISGGHTASGKPILSNDPHLLWSLPSTWYSVRIQAPDLRVAGVSLPGIPGVIIGHNDDIAWGVTNLGYDVQDLYQEHIDTQTLRYEFQGQQLPLQIERELLKIRGQRPETLDLLVTRHGPVLQLQSPQQRPAAGPSLGLSLRWIALDLGAFQFPFLEINRAKNWERDRILFTRIAKATLATRPPDFFRFARTIRAISRCPAGMARTNGRA